jgi:hypothetical protein
MAISRNESSDLGHYLQNTQNAQQGVLDEGVHFIQKPFSINDLAAKIIRLYSCPKCWIASQPIAIHNFFTAEKELAR